MGEKKLKGFFQRIFARNYEKKKYFEDQMLGQRDDSPIEHRPSILYWRFSDFI